MIFWKKHIPKKPKEELDQTPIAMPVTMHRPPTLQEQLARYTRQHLNRLAQAQGKETFEDANDFDIGEPVEPASLHEMEFGPEKEAEFERFVAQNTFSPAKPVVADAGNPASDAAGKTVEKPST